MNERIWVCVEKGWAVPATFVASVVISINISLWIKDELVKCN